MKIHQTVCDVCGAVKGESNHWFKAVIITDEKGDPANASPRSYPLSPAFAIRAAKDYASGKDLCGQACAAKLLSQWMATGEIDSPALREAVTL